MFIFAIVSLPILVVGGAIRRAEAKNNSGLNSSPLGADSIFQDCVFGCGQVQTDLENGAIDDVISLYNLPPTDRSRVIGYARNEVRAMLFITDGQFNQQTIADRRRASGIKRICRTYQSETRARRPKSAGRI